MLELYFIFFRIPKIMSALARERQRSALAWSIAGILAWLGAEIAVVFGIVIVYMIVTVVQGGPIEEEIPTGVTIVSYVLALGAAIGSFLIVKKILSSRPIPANEPPPPPPKF
jgi:ABC-type multidrug transport system permease subunit